MDDKYLDLLNKLTDEQREKFAETGVAEMEYPNGEKLVVVKTATTTLLIEDKDGGKNVTYSFLDAKGS